MLAVLISLLVALLIFGLIWWVVGLFPLPAPLGNVIRAVVAVILVIWILYLLLPLAAHPPHW